VQTVVNNRQKVLETLIKSSDYWIDILTDEVSFLLLDSFVTSQQSKFLTGLKSTTEPSECVVLADCAKILLWKTWLKYVHLCNNAHAAV
jgi:hypothetical protein